MRGNPFEHRPLPGRADAVVDDASSSGGTATDTLPRSAGDPAEDGDAVDHAPPDVVGEDGQPASWTGRRLAGPTEDLFPPRGDKQRLSGRLVALLHHRFGG
jgi:hypothetical protein